jgi:hypothetical protein
VAEAVVLVAHLVHRHQDLAVQVVVEVAVLRALDERGHLRVGEEERAAARVLRGPQSDTAGDLGCLDAVPGGARAAALAEDGALGDLSAASRKVRFISVLR